MLLESDVAALEAAGKKQVLKREWNFLSVLAMATCTLATWEAISALFAGAFYNGGPASLVYGFIIAALGSLCIAASLAEMASISPIAGAQYHWSAEHATPRWRAIVSYIQGWITLTGWIAAGASICFLAATMIQGIVVFNNPSYQPQRWHATLMMIAIAVFTALMNTYGKRLVPLWETMAGVLHILFFFIVLIAVNATSTKAPNKDVWATFVNASGWSSDGVSFCLGFVTPAFAFAGVEAVVHMSEETHDATRNIPSAMIWAVASNGIAGFAYIITILYSITDITSVLSTATGYPIIIVFYQAVQGNSAAATALFSTVLIMFMTANIGVFASLSRLAWAFSRDNGLPFSNYLSHITEWNKCPTRCVWLVVICVCLLSLINIGSTAAFNALLSLTNIGIYSSYAVAILVFTIRRFDPSRPITYGPWRLGRFGLAINILALAFCAFLIIFLPFPAVMPVTGVNMNYSSPVFVFVMACAAINYVLRARKKFVGPVKEASSETSSEIVHDKVLVEQKM